jgi:spermidine synthase
VIPWKLIDTADVPGGGEQLRLMQRGKDFAIKLGQNELMSSRLYGSEEALATLSCARIKARPAPRLLIGGLGMGFTLRAALKVLGPEARITVADLVPAVIAWARIVGRKPHRPARRHPRGRRRADDRGRARRL